MDKRFLKKNIVLFIVLGVSLCVVGFLLFMIISEHSEMQDYIRQTKEMVENVNKLNSQKPAPVTGNDALIKTDIVAYRGKVAEIRSYFGQPFYDARLAFVRVLLKDLKNDNDKELSDDEKISKFEAAINAFWEGNRMNTARDQIYISFKLKAKGLLGVDFKDFDTRWDDGLEAFRQEAKKHTHERLDEHIQDLFLFTFGFHRTMSFQIDKYDNYARQLRHGLIEYYLKTDAERKAAEQAKAAAEKAKAKPAEKSEEKKSEEKEEVPVIKKVQLLGKSSYFGFADDKVSREDIPKYVFIWNIVDDLARRIADAEITSLDKFTKTIAPTSEGNYHYYRFSFTVEGKQDAMRKVAENLHKAYSDRRIYIIRNIEIALTTDSLADLLNEEARLRLESLSMGGITAQANKDREKEHTPPNKQDAQEKQVKPVVPTVDESKIALAKRPSYAKVLFGGDTDVTATFTVDYVVYSTKEMR